LNNPRGQSPTRDTRKGEASTRLRHSALRTRRHRFANGSALRREPTMSQRQAIRFGSATASRVAPCHPVRANDADVVRRDSVILPRRGLPRNNNTHPGVRHARCQTRLAPRARVRPSGLAVTYIHGCVRGCNEGSLA